MRNKFSPKSSGSAKQKPMNGRLWALLLLVVLPGAAFMGGSAYFLFPDWTRLTASYQNYQKLAASPGATLRDLAVAEAAENRHRLNCFAEGIGVLLGSVILSTGIHGICTLPRRSSSP
jgi:hypothetical protein